MRYIDLDAVIASVPAKILDKLKSIDNSMQGKTDSEKEATACKGNVHWSPVKIHFEAVSGRKCWYTESKNPGCLNDVEHFRPKGKKTSSDSKIVHWYWFLAFNPINYRISCTLPNRLNKNPTLNATGGKHDHFPLLDNTKYATNLAAVVHESPVILDPCNKEDVDLLAFSLDGRPVISPRFSDDVIACARVEKSNLFLNLDYPTFNEDRERLYNKVKNLVERGDRYFAKNSDCLSDVTDDLRALFHPTSEYSKAAECYVRCFRDRFWIEEMF